jgi:hypothetical protein
VRKRKERIYGYKRNKVKQERERGNSFNVKEGVEGK